MGDLQVPAWALFVVSNIIGAVVAYFGALMAMRERLMKVETRLDAHKEDIDSIRGQLKDLRAAKAQR